jgi:hypothetical protein
MALGPFEYLLVFLSIVLGLALSDLCVSLNRLLEAAGRVRWDWLSPLAAIVAFLKLLTQWWTWFASANVAKGLTFGMFAMLMVSVVLLFLLAAVSLPDQVAEGDGVDLRAYYRQTARRYWLLYAAHYVTVNALAVWVQVTLLHSRLDWTLLLAVLFPTAAIVLAFVRVRLLHLASLVALIAVYLLQFAGHTLTQ